MTQFLGTTDVAVIGGGPGGIASAITAAERGLSVAVIESLSTIGGNLPYSSGYVALADTDLQRRKGVADSAELFLEDLRREQQRARRRFGGVLKEDVAVQYADESQEVYRWLEEMGVAFRTLIDRPAKHSVPRLHALEDPQAATHALKAKLDALDVYVLTNLKVDTVEVGESAFHISMTDQRSGEAIVADATTGAVVATGGFQANFEMRAEVQPEWLAESPYLGIPTTLGDGHRILAKLGARLVNMCFLPPFGHVATSFTEQAIAVNLNGERFHDETDPHETPVHLAEQPQRRAYYVFDEQTMQEKRAYILALDRKIVTAQSVAELATRLDIPGDRLQETLARFNEAVRAPDSGLLVTPRTNLPARAIDRAPYHAIEVVVGVSVTYGGAVTTPHGQVLDAQGDVIPGLFATGNANGSLAPVVETGGINLGAAFTVGRCAGAAIGRAPGTDASEGVRAT